MFQKKQLTHGNQNSKDNRNEKLNGALQTSIKNVKRERGAPYGMGMFESSYTENLDKTGGFGKIKFSGSVTFNINLLHHSYGGRMTVNFNSGHDTSKAELSVTNSAYGVVGGNGFGVVNDGSIDSTKTKDFSKTFTLNEMKDYGAVGMGPNMLMAKLALDIDAKKTGFAKWTYEDVPTKLWPVKPLSEMWGIP